MGLRTWWSSLSVIEKRALGAGALGLAGIGVYAIAFRSRGDSDPVIARAVAEAIAELGNTNPNDAADLAYWALYPECPEWLDPKKADHRVCIDLWLEVRNEARVQLGCARQRPTIDVYAPGSKRQIDLFRRSAEIAGVPASWAADPGLRYILARESGGIVGIPNYTYGWRAKEAACWPAIHEQIRNRVSTTKSNATGLGQLLGSNVDQYYPSGRAGIGDAVEEAVGMLRYIEARYGTPAAARACYGKGSEEDPCLVPFPGKRPKTFKEGY